MSAPKLRFKEFKSAYSEVSLGSIGEFKNGINKSKEDFGFGVPFVNLMDVFGKPFLTQSGFGLVNASAKEVDSYSLIKGDVLFIRSSVKPEGVGETSTILEDFANTVYSGFLIRFRETSPEKMLDINYKKYCFSIKSFRKQIMSLCTTSANTNINQDSLNGLKISIPNREEQCKIALFLSKIDQKISLLTQKHELFIQYKKGVMQKIFNQEIRFKDGAGKNFPNWDYVPLEEVLDYEQPGRYLVSSTEYSDDFETPVLTAGKTFLLGYTDEVNGIFTDLPVIIFDDFTTAFKFVDFPFKAKSSAMKMLKNKNPDNLLRYIYEAMCRIDFQGGDEHKRYWISQYSKISIPLPHHDEQIKILDFSVQIDKKIEIIKSKLELTKQYKQGLLQQMFI